MTSESDTFQPQVERFREYLLLLARVHIGKQFHGKLDASDVVQQTLLDAHRQREHFRGASDGELAAWLRRILAYNTTDAMRAFGRAKQDTSRECSLDDAVKEASRHVENGLVSQQASPSDQIQRLERSAQLADALAKLPELQREALVLRHCQGCPLDEICQRLDRSPSAVASLLKRGAKRLREVLHQLE